MNLQGFGRVNTAFQTNITSGVLLFSHDDGIFIAFVEMFVKKDSFVCCERAFSCLGKEAKLNNIKNDLCMSIVCIRNIDGLFSPTDILNVT